MKALTIGKLKAAIADLNDNIPVVLSAPDHGYRIVFQANKLTALIANGEIYEDHFEETLDEEVRIDVLLLE